MYKNKGQIIYDDEDVCVKLKDGRNSDAEWLQIASFHLRAREENPCNLFNHMDPGLI